MVRLDAGAPLNGKSAFLVYCLLFLALASPYLLGDVVAPHRQVPETGAAESQLEPQGIENRKFSDFALAYIPAVAEQVSGARSGWLTLWTNQTELGRPATVLGGFSGAYLPSWIAAQVTGSPWRFMTILSLSTCFLAGVFVFLFCREIGLSPLAGLIAAVALAASPFFMYWLTFPMFPAVFCWAAGILLALARLERRPSLAGWSLLAFCAYSLLMTAPPQPVIFHAYILAGYGLFLANRKRRAGWGEAGRFTALSTSAALAGLGLATPAYLDLARQAAESARLAPDPAFFTAVLPSVGSLGEAWRLFALSTAPELFGDPIDPGYPLPYDGVSITPLHIFFAIIGLLVAHKRSWGWWCVIVVLCLLAVVHPLYVLGVKYLGFNLSRNNPLGSIMLPLTVIVAYGADGLTGRLTQRERSRAVWAATAIGLAVIAIGLGYAIANAFAIRWFMVLAMTALVAALAAQYDRTRPVLLLLALVVTLAAISYPLMLRQDPARISTTSPLIQRLRETLPEGSRFAIAAPGVAVLPPNMNVDFGLASIHSYNSLSSKRYHALIEALGGEVTTYGRWNAAIAPDYDGAMFWMSNIGVMLAPARLTQRNLEYIGEESGVHVHKVASRMGDSIQVALAQDTSASALGLVDPRLLPRRASVKRSDQADRLEFDVTPGTPSVLILSQKFHRDWEALAFGHSGWVPAETIAVNGVFQGVLLPRDAEQVRLEFKPYARYAWIAHDFWLFLLVLIGANAWRTSYRARGKGVTAP